MKKIISAFLISSMFFISINMSFANNASSCKEEIIENASSPTFSPDWKSFAYVAEKDWKIFIVKDWVEIWKEYDRISNFLFSPDWKSFVFKANKNWKIFIVKDWVEIWKEYDRISNFLFSPDWKSFAYVAEKDWKNFIIKDWVKIWKEYDRIREILFSPDWKSFAFIWKKWLHYILVKDGEEKLEYLLSLTTSLSYSYNNVLYFTVKENRHIKILSIWNEIWGSFLDEKLLENYTHIWTVMFSPYWKSYSFKAQKNNSNFLIKDWKEYWPYDYGSINYFEYSPDWKGFFFIAKKDWKYITVINGNESEWYFYIYPPLGSIYSSDWKKYSFTIIKNWKDVVLHQEWIVSSIKKDWKSIIIKDWKEINIYDNQKNLIYSPDWKSFVYEAEKKWKNFLIKETCYSVTDKSSKATVKTEESKTSTLNKSLYTKQLIISRNNLNKNTKYKKYISQIDNIVIGLSREKWEQVLSRIQKVNITHDVIKYLEAKIYLEIYK